MAGVITMGTLGAGCWSGSLDNLGKPSLNVPGPAQVFTESCGDAFLGRERGAYLASALSGLAASMEKVSSFAGVGFGSFGLAGGSAVAELQRCWWPCRKSLGPSFMQGQTRLCAGRRGHCSPSAPEPPWARRDFMLTPLGAEPADSGQHGRWPGQQDPAGSPWIFLWLSFAFTPGNL